jgi:Bacterial Ig domain
MKNWILAFSAFTLTSLCAFAQNNVRMTITFDAYPGDVGWKIINSSNTTVVNVNTASFPGSDGNTTKTFDYNIPAGNYTFQMIDTYGDGLSDQSGSFSLSIIGGSILASGTNDYDGNSANTGTSTTVTYNIVIPGNCGGNVNPTASISASTSSVTAGTSFILNATASDANGNSTISKVEFYQGTTKIGEDLTSPYSLTHTEANVGTFSYTARAIDNCNGTGNSSAVNVTVTSNACQNNTAPSVSITAPTNNASVTAGSNLLLSATATDNGSITQVQFLNAGNVIATITSSPYNFTFTGITAGTYTFTARATDNCGTVTTSTVINVTVTGGSSSCNAWGPNCSTTGSISRSGQVGIGTANFGADPTFLLFVRGGLKAEKVQLELASTGGWADYVFEPDYRLMPLKEVAEYIKSKNHLPNMPSKLDIEKEGGIDVAKITVKQQEKIEELYLHLIQMNETIQGLKAELNTLKLENQALKAEMLKGKN